MSYSIIKEYTNKQGRVHQAHFSPSGKYLGPVSKKGDKPFVLTRAKPIVKPVEVDCDVVDEPVEVDCDVVDEPVEVDCDAEEEVDCDAEEPVKISPLMVRKMLDQHRIEKHQFVNGAYYTPTDEWKISRKDTCKYRMIKRTAKCIFLEQTWDSGTSQVFRVKIFSQDGVEFIKYPNIYANSKL